jgi:hypothetical protein
MKKIFILWILGAVMSIPPWGAPDALGTTGIFIQLIGLVISIIAIILLIRRK